MESGSHICPLSHSASTHCLRARRGALPTAHSELLVWCVTPHTSDLSLPLSSTASKQRKNVISCVTVHDSPYSDSSSNTSPYAVQHRAGHNTNAFDTKGSLDNHCAGNPRTIIVPPLKTQASEVLVECDSLVPGNVGTGQARVSVETGLLVFCSSGLVV